MSKKSCHYSRKYEVGTIRTKYNFWIIKQINYTLIYTCSHQRTKSKPQIEDNAMLGTSTDTTELNPVTSVLS